LSAPHCLVAITAHQQQTQRTVLDWLRVEHAIEKPSNKLLAVTELDSDAWVAEVQHPLTATGPQALRAEHARMLEPARAV
jgi:hypothetical protein